MVTKYKHHDKTLIRDSLRMFHVNYGVYTLESMVQGLQFNEFVCPSPYLCEGTQGLPVEVICRFVQHDDVRSIPHSCC